MVGRVMKSGRVSPVFFVDAEFAEQVSRLSWCPKQGYLRTSIKGKHWFLHQYVWFLAHGQKARLIEHLNHIRADCRLANLAESNHRKNLTNRNKPKKHGLPRGVYVNGKNFFATIWDGKKPCYLGTFSTPEQASEAYEAALKQHL